MLFHTKHCTFTWVGVCVICQCHFVLWIWEASQAASCVKAVLQPWLLRAFVSSVLCTAAMIPSLGVSEGQQVNPFKGVLWGSLQKASLVLVLLCCIYQHQWQWMFEYAEKEQSKLWIMLLNDQVTFLYSNPALGRSCRIGGNTLSLSSWQVLGGNGVREMTSVLNCKCLNCAIWSRHLAFNLNYVLWWAISFVSSAIKFVLWLAQLIKCYLLC